MIWAEIYLAAFLLLSIGGLIHDATKDRTWMQFAINILTVAAPALLVLQYIEPDLFRYPASIIALFGVTIAANWISWRTHIHEVKDELQQDELIDDRDIDFWSLIIFIVVLSPAFFFGSIAFQRML